MKRCDVSRTIMMKSVRAGEYTAPPAHGPIITDSCVCVCVCVCVCEREREKVFVHLH
jgi:hypothetical protein